jgi:hypothetical protein
MFSGGSISTAGNAAYAVAADAGGVVSLAGTVTAATGNGSGGLVVNGSGSKIDASDVTISTTGANTLTASTMVLSEISRPAAWRI